MPISLPATTPRSARTVGRDVDGEQRARRRQVVALGILGAQPDLDRPAALRRRRVVAERLAARDPDLLAHEIEPGRQLGHRVLDLQPRVDLEEVERARPGRR